MINSVRAVKFLMNRFPSSPDPQNPHLWEIFRHESYTLGDAESRRRLRIHSAKASYEMEIANNGVDSWLEKYFFPPITAAELQRKVVLDLGCFTGGRLVAWVEKYGLERGLGIDINPIFREAGAELASVIGVKDRVSFETGYGENLPYPNSSIDFIVSTDVFEHVRDLKRVLAECHRVLRPSGKLLCAFPQFLQPLEAHLGVVTKLPALHWVFSSRSIADALFRILRDRGFDASWYSENRMELEPWERLPHLNGTSVRSFRALVSSPEWIVQWKRRPILTDGRRSRELKFRLLSKLFVPLARLPMLEELFLGRICAILIKAA